MTWLNKLALICCVSGLSLALTGCPGPAPTTEPDGSTPIGTDASTCVPTPCGTRQCGDDGCGTECGICGPGTSCNEATWRCDPCTAESHADFCSRVAKLGKVCGSITDKDNCTKDTRTEDCGGCTDGKTCAPDNTCTGTCSYDGKLCETAGKNCGSFTANDNCGSQRTVNCGTCTTGDCIDNVCSGGAGCGNGNIDTGEACDGANLGTKTCQTEGLVSGTLTCNTNCTLNLSACVAGADCGNAAIDGKEQCDKTNLNGKTCAALGFPGGGTLACAANCTFNTAGCAAAKLCGNGTIDSGEDCDGSNLNSKTCEGLGFGGGTLACSPECKLVTDACTAGANCGNSTVDAPEQCDGTDLDSQTCESEGFAGGTLACKSNCTLDTSGCTGGTPPANDKCAAALDITSATMPVTGNAKYGTDDSQGSCQSTTFPMDGPDVVYSFTLTEHKSAEILVKRTGTGYWPTVYVRSACEDATTELGCKAYSSSGSTVVIKDLGPGTYYVIVDGEDETSGEFQLTLTLGEPIFPPANDKCDATGAGAEAITLDADGHGSVTGKTTADANDDTEGSCQSYSGADMVYVIDTTGLGPRIIKASAKTTSTSYDYIGVFIRKVCDSTVDTDELACDGSDDVVNAVTSAQDPGKYYIWVDAYSGDEGAFELTVDALAPPANDKCDAAGVGAEAITLDAATGKGSVTGDTTEGAGNDTAGSCETSDGGDLVYVVDTTGLGVRTLKATATSSSTSNYLGVFIRKVCDSALEADELACDDYDDTITATAYSLDPGKYYVWVDAYPGEETTFDLSVEALVPPANDRCDAAGAGAKPIVLDGSGHGSMTDTTVDAGDDAQGSCETYSGGDLVYVIDTTGMGPRNVTVTAKTGTSSYNYISLFMRKEGACNSTLEADQVACDYPTDDVSTLKASALPPGKYYIWVDAYPGDEGAFELTVDAVVPPANELCGVDGAGATELVFSGNVATVTGTTVGAVDDYQGGCESTYDPHDGEDLVYKFTIPAGANRSVTAVLTPDAASTTFKPAVYLKASCDGTAADLACAKTTTGGSAATSLLLSAAPGTTIYAFVDGVDATQGAYTLTVTLGTEIILPDACATAEAITLDADGHGTAMGDNSNAVHDTSGTCLSSTADGKDLVYELDTSALGERNVTATVKFQNTSASAKIWIRKQCDSVDAADEVACDYPIDDVATVTVKRLPAGKYWIWVESSTSTEGTYQLVVDAVVPPPSPCLTATVIDVSSGSGSALGSTVNTTNYTQGSCYGEVANDSVFKLTTTGPHKVTVTVTPEATTTSYKPTLYVRPFSACDSELKADELACVYTYTAGQAVKRVFNNLPAGEYALWVDGYGSSATSATNGDFTVSVLLETALDLPEDCMTAKVLDTSGLTDGNGVITVTGDTTDATNDAKSLGGCYGGSGNDLVYALTTTAEKDLKVDLTYSDSTVDAFVYVRKGACTTADPADQLGCDDPSGSPATTLVKRLPAGTYYIWADGYSTSDKGAFTMTVTLSEPAPAPAGDLCATAVALTKNVTVDGDTTPATADYGDSFNTTCYYDMDSWYGADAPANELVYTYTTTAAENFTIEVVPTGWDAAIWYTKGTCGGDGADCVAAIDAAGTSTPTETLDVTGTANTTYYIYVDGYSSSQSGPFTITIK